LRGPINAESALSAEANRLLSVELQMRAKGVMAKLHGAVGQALLSGESAVVKVADLRELVELAEEGWQYAEAYFREKWDAEARLAKARAMLGDGK